MQREEDILAGGLVATPEAPTNDYATHVRKAAARLNISPDVSEDYLNVTGGIESGNRQFTGNGAVLTGPPTKQTGAHALGGGQVMPDVKGGTVRTIHGRQYDLTDPEQNAEAGLLLFSAGGSDPVARRLEYFGGPTPRRRYERTGQIPQGGDGYTTFQQYVDRTMGKGQRQKPETPDILSGGLVDTAPPRQPANAAPVTSQVAGTGQTTAATPPQTAGAGSVTPPEATPGRPLTPKDAAWHFGQPIGQRDVLSPQAMQVLAQAVAEDDKKRQAGQQIWAPTPEYQAQMRAKAGLPPLVLTPENLTKNVLWHFGPLDGRQITPRMARVLDQAVREDDRRRAAGQEIAPPTPAYQNEMRRRAGLPPLKYNQSERTYQFGSVTLRLPNSENAVAPVYRPEDLRGSLPNFTVPQITVRQGPTVDLDAEDKTRARLNEANYMGLKRYQEKLLRDYPTPADRVNIAHNLHTEDELRQLAADQTNAQIEMMRRRPEIDALKDKFKNFAGDVGGPDSHGSRMVNSG